MSEQYDLDIYMLDAEEANQDIAEFHEEYECPCGFDLIELDFN